MYIYGAQCHSMGIISEWVLSMNSKMYLLHRFIKPHLERRSVIPVIRNLIETEYICFNNCIKTLKNLT